MGNIYIKMIYLNRYVNFIELLSYKRWKVGVVEIGIFCILNFIWNEICIYNKLRFICNISWL